MERTAPSAEALAGAEVLWRYHRLGHTLAPCDVMLVPCSNDLRVADHAAQLALRGLTPKVVFSGGVAHQGDLLATGWSAPEAEVFAERAIALGLPEQQILLETHATNTGENFVLSRRALDAAGIAFESALLVQKPFMERRTFATGRKLWPDVRLLVSSPPIPFHEYLHGSSQDPNALIHLMVGDLQRIQRYAEQGFQIPQDIPEPVWAAFQRFSQCRGSAECRDAHLAGFAAPLTRAAGARRTRHRLRA